jgi:hypothetical protein
MKRYSNRKGRGVNARGRSEKPEYFWMFPYSMARSPAFRGLSGAAVKLLVHLRCYFTRYGDGSNNNGELMVSYAMAADQLGLGTSTIKRAYAELLAAGFIVNTHKGRWYGRQAHRWRLTFEPYKSELPSHDWRKWQPQKQNTRPEWQTKQPDDAELGAMQAYDAISGASGELK